MAVQSQAKKRIAHEQTLLQQPSLVLDSLHVCAGRLSTNTLVQVLDLVSQLAPCPPDPTSPLAASSSSSGSSSKAMRGKTCGHHRQLQQYQGLEELQKGQQQGQQTEQARPVDQQHERQQQQQLGQQQQRVEQLRRGRGPQGTTILPGPAGPKAPSSDAPFSAGPTPRSFYSSFYAIAAAVVVRNLRTKVKGICMHPHSKFTGHTGSVDCFHKIPLYSLSNRLPIGGPPRCTVLCTQLCCLGGPPRCTVLCTQLC
eukprot:1160018-Pelagomonas_calceolata.AAC.15